jgi:hypothetical protein
MLTNFDSDSNTDGLTDTEIYTAIRYLEPDPRNPKKQNTNDDNKDGDVAICVCLYIALFVCFAFFWFYYWR